jgi:hypothetical protein
VDAINHHVLDLLNMALVVQSEQTLPAQLSAPAKPDAGRWGPTRAARRVHQPLEPAPDTSEMQVG